MYETPKKKLKNVLDKSGKAEPNTTERIINSPLGKAGIRMQMSSAHTEGHLNKEVMAKVDTNWVW